MPPGTRQLRLYYTPGDIVTLLSPAIVVESMRFLLSLVLCSHHFTTAPIIGNVTPAAVIIGQSVTVAFNISNAAVSQLQCAINGKLVYAFGTGNGNGEVGCLVLPIYQAGTYPVTVLNQRAPSTTFLAANNVTVKRTFSIIH